jgi:ATP-dependent Clp protease ATP-binding subunit ClpC
MYERFTDRARKVMQLANQEAQRFNHEYIGTEHILLGLVKEGSGVAATVLKNLDIDLRKIRLEVEKIVQIGPGEVTGGKLPQTPRAKKVIEYSIEEARALNHNYVGTEHLLLGLVREVDGVAGQVLMNLGASCEALRSETLKLLDQQDRIHLKKERVTKTVTNGATTPPLDFVGRGLTEMAQRGTLAPVVMREPEIERVFHVLACQDRHHGLLVGEPGSGRRSLVHAFAHTIARGRPFPGCADRMRVISFTPQELFTLDRPKLTDRCQAMLDELGPHADSIVLCWDEWHLVSGPLAVLAFDDLLRRSMRMGVRTLVRITPVSLALLNQSDPELVYQFQQIAVAPMTPEQTLEVLRGRRALLEEAHGVRILDEAITAAAHGGGILPGAAVATLDRACASLRVQSAPRPVELSSLEEQIANLRQRVEECVAEHDFEGAAHSRDQAARLATRQQELAAAWRRTRPNDGIVTGAAIARINGAPVDEVQPQRVVS